MSFEHWPEDADEIGEIAGLLVEAPERREARWQRGDTL
jgi:hypothetical protein